MIRATWPGTAVSDNDRLAHGKQGRMFANKEYTAFKEGMADRINDAIQGVAAMGCLWDTAEGRKAVTLRVDLPPRMDTSAIIKAAGDAVQLSGAIKNDNQIDRWVVERVGRSPRGQSKIEFEIQEV